MIVKPDKEDPERSCSALKRIVVPIDPGWAAIVIYDYYFESLFF